MLEAGRRHNLTVIARIGNGKVLWIQLRKYLIISNWKIKYIQMAHGSEWCRWQAESGFVCDLCNIWQCDVANKGEHEVNLLRTELKVKEMKEGGWKRAELRMIVEIWTKKGRLWLFGHVEHRQCESEIVTPFRFLWNYSPTAESLKLKYCMLTECLYLC